ncbi:exopolysaccharide production repressor protein [Mesorhizobium sp. M0923]|uniref:exopolysaccharide production repressor protein n=1 Tax=Mesorhizobium sp. M0923 TaxID=2957028 RepID=UPI0033385B9E
MVTTLACSLLLQVAYFVSVLFLIWRSGCACRAGRSRAFRELQGSWISPDRR